MREICIADHAYIMTTSLEGGQGGGVRFAVLSARYANVILKTTRLMQVSSQENVDGYTIQRVEKAVKEER